jgi:hypothetical protein
MISELTSASPLQSAFEQELSRQLASPGASEVDRFEQMMANAVPHAPVNCAQGETIVSKAVAEQDAAAHAVGNDLLYMMQDGSSLQESPAEAMMRTAKEAVYVSIEEAQFAATVDVNMAMAKTGRSDVETLMKNS